MLSENLNSIFICKYFLSTTFCHVLVPFSRDETSCLVSITPCFKRTTLNANFLFYFSSSKERIFFLVQLFMKQFSVCVFCLNCEFWSLHMMHTKKMLSIFLLQKSRNEIGLNKSKRNQKKWH